MSWKNVGSWDRALRLALGASMLAAGWGGFLGGTAGVVLKFLGFVPLATALVGSCPVYRALGLSTRRAEAARR